MVHFSINHSLISFHVAVLLSSFASSSHTNKVVELVAICNQSVGDITFCLKLLNSTPPGPGADLVTLAQFTTNAAHNNVTNMISLIKDLMAKDGGDPAEEQFLEECLSCYNGEGGALHDVEAIQQGLKSRDYAAMYLSLQRMFQSNFNCIFKQEPPKHPKLLDEYGATLDKVSAILFNILECLTNNY